jgi:hypothetical protein
MSKKDKTFWVTSLYGGKTREPRVNFAMPGGEYVQMSPEEARDLALNLLQCADAAESDGFVFEFIKDKVGAPDEISARILGEFREYRDKRRETST